MEIISAPKIISPIAGRKPERLKFKNLESAIKKIDDNLHKAIDVLVDGLNHYDMDVRFRCAELLIRKAIPDRKIKEITGDGGGPVRVETVDKRMAILGIVQALDGITLDDIKSGKLQIESREDCEMESGEGREEDNPGIGEEQ